MKSISTPNVCFMCACVSPERELDIDDRRDLEHHDGIRELRRVIARVPMNIAISNRYIYRGKV